MDGAHVHNYKELTPDLSAYGHLKKVRSEARKTSIALKKLNMNATKNYTSIDTHSNKIKNCSVHGAFRQITSRQNHKIGQALCRSKVCPICQSVLSWKRRNKAGAFFLDNQQLLSQYHYYHMVLTVKHDKHTRNNLYTKEIVKYYTALRGEQNRHYKQDWDAHIHGGTYSVEITHGRNGTPHIHIHSILIAHTSIDHNSGFFRALKQRWRSITGDSTNIRIEPVYSLKQGSKQEYIPNVSNVSILADAFQESTKYTMKTTSMVFNALGSKFMDDLLTTRTRMYSRFGCLYNHKNNNSGLVNLEKLATDYKDLADLEMTDHELYDCFTGEVIDKSDTKIVVTPMANTSPFKVHDSTIYAIKSNEVGKVKSYHPEDMQTAAVALSKTIKARYRKENDV